MARHGNQVLFDLISQLEKPVIAAINGYALGGGLELAMACHLRIAVQHAKMGLPEVSLGIIPGYGGTQRLPYLIGKGNAMEMILTGDMISAEKALEMGLVNQVVPPKKLLESTITFAERLMKNGGSMVTLTYDGSQKYIRNYNVMGVAKAALESSVRYLAADLGPSNIRVNALSAGPMKTLAMAGISGGKDMMKWSEKNSLMNRNISLEDVGKSGLYLVSDMSSGVTGEVHYVDCGYNKVGVPKEI